MTGTLADLGLPSEVMIWKAFLLTVVSLVVGVLGGYVGLALGTVRLTTLLLLGVPPPIAAGTNIIVSTSGAFSGAVRHFREGRVDLQMVLIMGVTSFPGALVGGFGSTWAPEHVLTLIVGVLVVWQGVEFVGRSRRMKSAARESLISEHPASLGPNRIAAGAVIGAGVGLLGGMVGLILGTLRLPALVRVLRLEPQMAAGTNLFIGFFMGALGWVGHVAQRQVDYPLVVLMAATAMAGSYLGAMLTGRSEPRSLSAGMGLVLVVVGVLLLLRSAAGLA